MIENPNIEIEVGGHTDNTGDDQANLALSLARAEAVANFLVEAGVPQERLVPTGYGELQPVDSNDTEAGRANNRRTEIKIIRQ